MLYHARHGAGVALGIEPFADGDTPRIVRKAGSRKVDRAAARDKKLARQSRLGRRLG